MEWIKIVDNAADLHKKINPGKPQLLVVGGTRICLARINEKIFAVHDKCTHNGESLSKGNINYLGEVVCPWHGYRFNMRNGQCQNDAADLATFPTKENEHGFFIGL